MKWELRPVKEPCGRLMIREVYYNHKGARCHIEMDISVPYDPEFDNCVEELIKSYPDVKIFNRYNPEIISFNPEKDSLAEWTLSSTDD